MIATGESQSAQRLATYINSVMPLDNVYDAAFLLSNFGQQIRTDVLVPTFKVLFEWDTQSGEAALRQPDSDMYWSWEVAGTAHVDHHLRLSREPLELRDLLVSSEANLAPTCTVPTIGSRVPNHYVVAAAIDSLVRWKRRGQQPAASPRFEIASFGPGSAAKIARNSDNLALGAIRSRRSKCQRGERRREYRRRRLPAMGLSHALRCRDAPFALSEPGPLCGPGGQGHARKLEARIHPEA
jgi:hypothetical protein